MAIYQGTTKVASNIISGDTLPIGSMIPYGSLTIPEGWLRCDGSAVSRTTYSHLFSVIGTSYGVGNGSTTFNLPNKKGRVSVGYDSAQTEFDTIGKEGGAKTHTLTIDEMPSHSHKLAGSPDGAVETPPFTPFDNSNTGASTTYTYATNTMSEGGGLAHNNLQPYETDVWIIKALQTPGVVATVVDNLVSTSSVNALSAKQGKVLNDGIEALDTNKAPKASPTFTGTVILPSSTSINGNTVLTAADNTDSGWLSLNDQVNYRKVNNIVTVVGLSSNAVSVGNGVYTNVGTLPAGYRPTYVSHFEWSSLGGNFPTKGGNITTAGAIGLYLPSGVTTAYWGFTITFLV